MLKMKCPHCRKFITSQLLAEYTEIACEHCRETVPVADVMVSAKGFTFHRDDLVKRLFRYKALINEVAKERDLLEKDPKASSVSKHSLDQVLLSLKEVMAGARKNLRLEFSETLPVSFSLTQQVHAGVLTNLSMTGACITTGAGTPLPNKKNHILIQFSLPGQQQDYALEGVVSWVNKDADVRSSVIGIKFNSQDDAVIESLWDFISNSNS